MSNIPSERTVYRIMNRLGLIHIPKHKPKVLTKADKEAQKSDDKVQRDFAADKPLKKCVTDITEIKTADGRLYISAIEDCFDNAVLGLSMADNMKASLCVNTFMVCQLLLTEPACYSALAYALHKETAKEENKYRSRFSG